MKTVMIRPEHCVGCFQRLLGCAVERKFALVSLQIGGRFVAFHQVPGQAGHLGREPLKFGGKEMILGQIAQDQFGQGRGLAAVPGLLEGLPVLLLAQPELMPGQGSGIGNHHGYRVAAPADDHLGKLGGAHQGGQIAGCGRRRNARGVPDHQPVRGPRRWGS